MKAFCLIGDHLRHFADSSSQRNFQPWFVPDDGEKWFALICPAVKINRLGTHIAPKFARRYYDDLSVACVFLPESAVGCMATADERYFVRDAAYCIGEAVSAAENDGRHVIDAVGQTINFSLESLNVDAKLAELSTFCTMKNGRHHHFY